MSCCGRANREIAARANVTGQEASNRDTVATADRNTAATADRDLTTIAAAPPAPRVEHTTAARPIAKRRATANRLLTARAIGAFFARADRVLVAASDRCAPIVDISGLCPALQVYRECYATDLEAVVNWPIAPACT